MFARHLLSTSSLLTKSSTSTLRSFSRSHLPTRAFSSAGGMSFVGPKSLSEILDKPACADLGSDELAAIWMEHHNAKPRAIGWISDKETGLRLVEKADTDSCGFFIAPVFNADQSGHYNLVVQFFPPCHFVCANLEEYKQQPGRADAVLSFSVFNDYALDKGVSLLRADVVADTLSSLDAQTVIKGIVRRYGGDETETKFVEQFNHKPETFDFEEYLEHCKIEWAMENKK